MDNQKSRLQLDVARIDFHTSFTDLLGKLDLFSRTVGFGSPDHPLDTLEPRSDGDAGPNPVAEYNCTEFEPHTGEGTVQRWSEKEYRSRRARLHEDQLRPLEMVESHACADADVTDPLFLFVTGPGGTGKSEVLHCMAQSLGRAFHFHSFAIASFTGTASFLIGGVTLHSLLVLPVVASTQPYPKCTPMWGSKLRELQGYWYNKKFLLIDEISMMSSDMMNFIDYRLRQLNGVNLPYGGVSIVAFGDFYQLPPCGRANPVFDTMYSATGGGMHPWNSHFIMMTLTKNYRALGDPAYTSFLARLRIGDRSCLNDDLTYIAQRLCDLRTVPSDVPVFLATRAQVRENTQLNVLRSTSVNKWGGVQVI